MSILWPSIIKASPLASLLAHTYDSIAASRIAHVPISKTVETSLQIPQSISTQYAPTPSEPQMPGLWLTTASMADDDDESGRTLSPYAALLLLEDKDTLLKQVEKDNHELASPLAFFIREVSPTKSLQKLAVRLSLRLPDLQYLARHLIYWRRARAIPPLHTKDTYITSPNADMRQLSAAAIAYERRFTGLPSLPRMLHSLSARPVHYGWFIPSLDHKAVYMEMLAYLLRDGWVTQLRTFVWVKVSPSIKAKAAAQARHDEVSGTTSTKGSSAMKRVSVASGASSSGHNTNSQSLLTEDEKTSEAKSSRSNSVADLLSPLVRPVSERERDNSNRSETASVMSNRTALNIGPSPSLRPSPLSHIGHQDQIPPFSVSSPSPVNASLGTNEDSSSGLVRPPTEPFPEQLYEPSLILEPSRATALESRWLALIGEGFVDADLKGVWPLLTRYFDGRFAVEDIAAREGWKRSKVSSLMARLEREGVLCLVRHW